jgi:imidazolonepropionase-like amidohydrolase
VTHPRLARLLLPFILCAALLAQRLPGQTLLLKGATVHTISGQTLSPGQVLIRDGKIAAVGETVENAGATSIDLTGQHLYPGLIALDSGLGLTEIEAVRATADSTEVGDFTPDVATWVAVNPDSELLPVARANGITYFEPAPVKGIVSGQSGLMTMDGWTTEEMTLKKPVALHVFWPTMELEISEKTTGKAKPKSLEDQRKERLERIRTLTEFFAEAKAYAKAKDAAEKGQSPASQRIPAWEAMLPYVSDQLPIMVHADEIRQIKSASAWAGTNHYKVIIVGGRDAWMAAGQLAENHIPVIYEDTFTLPTRDTESYDVHFSAPEILRKAGVTIAFSMGPSAFDAPSARNLPYAAAQAVAFGLPEEEALKSLTLIPAQLIGVAERLGSIESGKVASLFSADGSILDIRSHVKHVWIAGKEVSLETRHTRLYEKYRNRPKRTQ